MAYQWKISKTSFWIIFLMLCFFIIEAEMRPSWTMPNYYRFDKKFEESRCTYDGEILELCQRCAKATKSDFAYPMCCSNEENAVQWCHDYVYFGIQ